MGAFPCYLFCKSHHSFKTKLHYWRFSCLGWLTELTNTDVHIGNILTDLTAQSVCGLRWVLSFFATNCDFLSALTTIPHASFLTFSSSFHFLFADVYLSVPQAGQVDPGTALNLEPRNFTQVILRTNIRFLTDKNCGLL